MGDLELRAFELEFNRQITKRERFMIKLVDKVYLGDFKRPGWTGNIGFYLFECKDHGFVTDYPHTHHQVLTCPLCQEKRTKESQSAISKEQLSELTKELRDMEKL